VLAVHRIVADRLGKCVASRFIEGSDEALMARIAASSGDGCHQIGMARMGTGPSDSVTDADGRVHTIGNLFVAGSSVFPRSGQANPTLTIACQSIRLARFLSTRGARRLRNG
jgi:choline dehydrogenase-like flavoprotein